MPPVMDGLSLNFVHLIIHTCCIPYFCILPYTSISDVLLANFSKSIVHIKLDMYLAFGALAAKNRSESNFDDFV